MKYFNFHLLTLIFAMGIVFGFSGLAVAAESGGGGYNAPECEGAGPYSSAQACFNPTACDRGIAGFVGPDDEGAARLGEGEDVINANNYVNPIFKSWATQVIAYTPSDETGFYGMNGISTDFSDPTKMLGPVTGDNFDIVSLGDRDATEIAEGVAPGILTLGFPEPISNDVGADFAVFENGFISAGGAGVSGQIWAELTYCEVSSDNINFVRFPNISLTPDLVGPYGTVDPTNVYNLVGKHVNAYGSSWGTSFDLEDLVSDPLVQNGTVDLNDITYVRLVDIAGNGAQLDSDNNPIYDGWLTWGSGGADINAIGVIRHFGEFQTALAGDGVLGWNWNSNDGALRLEYSGLLADTSFNAIAWSDENAFSLLADLDEFRGTDYRLMNCWKIEADNVAFAVDGGVTLFGYFDPCFTGAEDDLFLMHWTGTLWENVGILNVDLDNFLLTSQILPGAESAIYAIVAVYLLPGDANGDHRVDVGDLGILAANYGTETGATWAMGDFNFDEAVDVGDLGVLAANYGAGTSAAMEADENNEDEDSGISASSCIGLGLPLIAGLMMMGLMLTRLEE